MAHFLDPELEALRTGRATPAKGSAPAQRRTPNKFGKSCHGCGIWTGPQKGYLGKADGAWVVYCQTCP